jgi:hypothetical protein
MESIDIFNNLHNLNEILTQFNREGDYTNVKNLIKNIVENKNKLFSLYTSAYIE